MSDVVSYKCPNCAAPLSFDIESQSWSCKFCSSSFALSDLESQQPEGAQNTADAPIPDEPPAMEASEPLPQGEHGEAFGEDAMAYECPSCGGRIITDEVTAATFCPFCHNPAVLNARLQDEFRPAVVIPFQLERDAAVKAVQKLCKGKPLLPRAFKDSVHKGEVSGMYVPFWLFDCDVHARLDARAQRIAVWSDRNYRYTKTDTYRVVREGNMSLRHVPADGSSKMDNALMESLEPFDYSKLTSFNMGYLSGHYAENYDMDSEQVGPRVEKRIRSGVEKVMRDTVSGYNTVQVQGIGVRRTNQKCSYAMLPVWTLMHSFGDKSYLFAMNGQTGKTVGKLPMSVPRLLAVCAGSWLVSFLILMLVVLLG